MTRGTLFVISAPSGAGKTSLVKALLASEPRLRLSVSHTTRRMRPTEQQGREYHFVSTLQFERLRDAGEFLEHARVFDNCYGTSRAFVEEQLQAARRLADAAADMSHYREFDYVVVNDDFEKAVGELRQIIAGHGADLKSSRPDLAPLLTDLLAPA